MLCPFEILKILLSLAWWHISVILVTWETEAGGSLLQFLTIAGYKRMKDYSGSVSNLCSKKAQRGCREPRPLLNDSPDLKPLWLFTERSKDQRKKKGIWTETCGAGTVVMASYVTDSRTS